MSLPIKKRSQKKKPMNTSFVLCLVLLVGLVVAAPRCRLDVQNQETNCINNRHHKYCSITCAAICSCPKNPNAAFQVLVPTYVQSCETMSISALFRKLTFEEQNNIKSYAKAFCESKTSNCTCPNIRTVVKTSGEKKK